MRKVAIFMGSKSDLSHCERIKKMLEYFGLETIMKVASAHKTPERVLKLVRELEKEVELFITVAGRSNALSGLVDAQTFKPVIASPVLSERFGGADIFSSLRMPSGVAPLVILEPEEAALAAAKIIGLYDPQVREKVKAYQEEKRKEVEEAQV
jgi:5-(carboxyamino)imidazole ribonucleotide mutase